MTEATIWRRAASLCVPMESRRSLQRSMQERTWERDLLPRKQMLVTYASVDATRGFVTSWDRAMSCTASMRVPISESGALVRRSRRISQASVA